MASFVKKISQRLKWCAKRGPPIPSFILSIVGSSAVGYSLLFAVSLGLAYWQGRLDEISQFPGWPRFGGNLLVGVLLATAVLCAGWALRGTFRWARELGQEFRIILAPLTLGGALVLAVASGIAEETFFRGVMQPVFGLWETSLAFGLLHYPMNRRLIPWTIMAIIMGFAFGLVYQTTDSLFAVALAHGLINFVELADIARGEPDANQERGGTCPS